MANTWLRIGNRAKCASCAHRIINKLGACNGRNAFKSHQPPQVASHKAPQSESDPSLRYPRFSPDTAAVFSFRYRQLRDTPRRCCARAPRVVCRRSRISLRRAYAPCRYTGEDITHQSNDRAVAQADDGIGLNRIGQGPRLVCFQDRRFAHSLDVLRPADGGRPSDLLLQDLS